MVLETITNLIHRTIMDETTTRSPTPPTGAPTIKPRLVISVAVSVVVIHTSLVIVVVVVVAVVSGMTVVGADVTVSVREYEKNNYILINYAVPVQAK